MEIVFSQLEVARYFKYKFIDSADMIPNTAPIHSVINHDAIIKPAFLECVDESFSNHNEELFLVATTIAAMQIENNDHKIRNRILLNFIKTILKSDSFLTVVFTTRYLFTKTVTIVENKLSVIPATGQSETSLKLDTMIPALMNDYIYTLGCSFYDWVYDDAKKEDIIRGTVNAISVLTQALLLSDQADFKSVLIKVRPEPPILNTGHEKNAIATPIKPNVQLIQDYDFLCYRIDIFPLTLINHIISEHIPLYKKTDMPQPPSQVSSAQSVMAELRPKPIVMMNAMRENICQYQNRPRKSIHVMTTANAAYTEFTTSEVDMFMVLEKPVKQLVQNVMKSMLSSILKNEINKSKRSENSDSFLQVELISTKARTVIRPRVMYCVLTSEQVEERQNAPIIVTKSSWKITKRKENIW